MTKMMVGGLVGMMSVAAFVVGCSGGSVSSPPDDSSGNDNAPAGASLPEKADSAPTKGTTPGGGAQTPSSPTGGTQTPSNPGTPSSPAQPGDPGGTPGQPGMSGTSSDGAFCCYNNTQLACDSTQCFGGYDEDACEAKCNQTDFDCMIACVDALGSAGPPTAKCKPTGNKC